MTPNLRNRRPILELQFETAPLIFNQTLYKRVLLAYLEALASGFGFSLPIKYFIVIYTKQIFICDTFSNKRFNEILVPCYRSLDLRIYNVLFALKTKSLFLRLCKYWSADILYLPRTNLILHDVMWVLYCNDRWPFGHWSVVYSYSTKLT